MCKVSLVFLFTLVSAQLAAQSVEFRSEFRPEFASTVSVESLKEKLNQGKVIVIDVRLEEDFRANPVLIPGAIRKDPEKIQDWILTLSKEDEVVVYCVAGKWVSQKAAYLLDQAGISVQSLTGGHSAWQQEAE